MVGLVMRTILYTAGGSPPVVNNITQTKPRRTEPTERDHHTHRLLPDEAVEPGGVDGVLLEGGRLEELHQVLHRRADVPADLDLLQAAGVVGGVGWRIMGSCNMYVHICMNVYLCRRPPRLPKDAHRSNEQQPVTTCLEREDEGLAGVLAGGALGEEVPELRVRELVDSTWVWFGWGGQYRWRVW